VKYRKPGAVTKQKRQREHGVGTRAALNFMTEEELRVSIKQRAVDRTYEVVRRREVAKEYGLLLEGASTSVDRDGRCSLRLAEDFTARVVVEVAGHVLTVRGEYPSIATIAERSGGWRGVCMAARELLIVRSAARRLGASQTVQL
jgi:hypothetical protein